MSWVLKTIAVIDECKASALEQPLEAVLPAMQRYADAVQEAWALPATLLVRSDAVPASAPAIVLLDDADQADALGYHEVTPGGYPLARVFVRTAQKDGEKATVTLSHELAEMMADPFCQLMAQQPATGDVYAYELCDAVEGDAFEIDGVAVSDFVLPPWFGWPGVKYDFLGRLSAPWSLSPGGYSAVIRQGQATDVFGSQQKAEAFAREDRRGHRTTRWKERAHRQLRLACGDRA